MLLKDDIVFACVQLKRTIACESIKQHAVVWTNLNTHVQPSHMEAHKFAHTAMYRSIGLNVCVCACVCACVYVCVSI